MARFSMVVAEPKYQMFSTVSYKLKDNEDKDSPINTWIGTEEKCKEMLKWLNDNVVEFDFWGSKNEEEQKEYLERRFDCKVILEYATINDTILIKFENPISDLRDELSSALNIDCDSISIYNTKMWKGVFSEEDDLTIEKDDLAIINRSMM